MVDDEGTDCCNNKLIGICLNDGTWPVVVIGDIAIIVVMQIWREKSIRELIHACITTYWVRIQ